MHSSELKVKKTALLKQQEWLLRHHSEHRLICKYRQCMESSDFRARVFAATLREELLRRHNQDMVWFVRVVIEGKGP